MAAHSSRPLTTLSRRRWLGILSKHVTSEIEPPIRRGSRRYGIEFGAARLRYQQDGESIDRTVQLLQISAAGVMVKNRGRVQPHTPVWMEITLADDVFSLLGQVAHCTQTVGGYKVGIELQFPDENPQPPRGRLPSR